VPGEFSDVKHVKGILSMGRWDDPNSATSSFSVLLGNAPHLDRTYCVFGTVTKGWEVLEMFETLPTRREGIFVMPKERITYVWPPSNRSRVPNLSVTIATFSPPYTLESLPRCGGRPPNLSRRLR
jgi:cyclophilin family peptidyl-prolyl cis-trans isomerase